MAHSPEDKPQRKRLLNVIYFVDASRTRSFRMPLSRLNFLLFAAILLILWSGISIALLVREQAARQVAEQRLRDAMATIFEYESLYDGAYEVAYPRGSFGQQTAAVARAKQAGRDRAVAQPKAQPNANSQVTSNAAPTAPTPNKAAKVAAKPNKPATQAKAAPKPAPKPAAKVATTPAPAATTAAAPQPSPAPTRPEFSVSVESPVVNAEDNFMTLSFRIDNDNKPTRTEGYVWAVAEFEDGQGRRRYLGAPEEISVDGSGGVQTPQRSHRFSISNYKNKKFQFNFPRDLAGRFTRIRIGLMGVEPNQKKNYFNLPVNIRIGPQNVQGGDQAPPESKSGALLPGRQQRDVRSPGFEARDA